jgi:alpha-mannosidase
VTTGRIYPIPGKARDMVVKDSSGRAVPSQVIKAERDREGHLVVANLAFRAEKVPSVGYDTYYVEFTPAAVETANSDLQINEPQLELENQFVKVRLSPRHGAVISLIDKQTGREMLDAKKGAFPIFKGTPNQAYPLAGIFARWRGKNGRPNIPAAFDSSKSVARLTQKKQDPALAGIGEGGGASEAVIRWVERGPLRATVKTTHKWPSLKIETYITLGAGVPWVEVTSRVLAEVPPAPDELDANRSFPIEIKNGYWLTFAPSFQPSSLIRDFPFGVEPTEHQAFHALTFVDWVGKDAGLLVLHPGTQYFRRESDGTLSNLLMREWESHWTGEYGWPRYSEYRHALMPHGAGLTHAQRLRAASEFGQELITVVGQPRKGSLPKRKGFITVRPDGVQLSAFRKKNGRGFEFRVVEVEGQEAAAGAELAIPVAGAVETDLLGRKMAEVLPNGNQFSFDIQPWKIRTFEVT